MTTTFVIFGNVGNVTAVLRPSSDIKMMEDSTGDGFLHRRWSHNAAHAEQHAHRGAGFVVALAVKTIGGGKPCEDRGQFSYAMGACGMLCALRVKRI